MCRLVYVFLNKTSVPFSESIFQTPSFDFRTEFFLHIKKDTDVKNFTIGYKLTEWHTQESDVINKKYTYSLTCGSCEELT